MKAVMRLTFLLAALLLIVSCGGGKGSPSSDGGSGSSAFSVNSEKLDTGEVRFTFKNLSQVLKSSFQGFPEYEVKDALGVVSDVRLTLGEDSSTHTVTVPAIEEGENVSLKFRGINPETGSEVTVYLDQDSVGDWVFVDSKGDKSLGFIYRGTGIEKLGEDGFMLQPTLKIEGEDLYIKTYLVPGGDRDDVIEQKTSYKSATGAGSQNVGWNPGVAWTKIVDNLEEGATTISMSAIFSDNSSEFLMTWLLWDNLDPFTVRLLANGSTEVKRMAVIREGAQIRSATMDDKDEILAVEGGTFTNVDLPSGVGDDPGTDPDYLTVISSFPADEATDISIATSVEKAMSDDIASIENDSITVVSEAGSEVVGTTSFQGRYIFFMPESPLSSGTLYTVTVSGVVGESGGVMSNDHTSTFTTGGPGSGDPETFSLTSYSPEQFAETDSVFRLRFDEVVDPGSVLGGSISIMNNDIEDYIDITIQVSGATVTVTPDQSLTLDTSYTVTVHRSVESQDGIILDQMYSWTVTTPTVLGSNCTDREGWFLFIENDPIAGAEHENGDVEVFQSTDPWDVAYKAPIVADPSHVYTVEINGDSLRNSMVEVQIKEDGEDRNGDGNDYTSFAKAEVRLDGTATVTLQPSEYDSEAVLAVNLGAHADTYDIEGICVTTSVVDPDSFVVMSTLPERNAENVSLTTRIELETSNELDPSFVTVNSVRLRDEHGNDVDFDLDVDDNIITLTPDAPLDSFTSYIATFMGIADVAGNTLSAIVNFRTGGTIIDDTTFNITEREPVGTGMPNDNIVVVFDGLVDPATVSNLSFRIIGPGDIPVSGIHSVSGDTITFIPYVPLAFGSNFTVTILGSIADVSGHTLGGSDIFSFSTPLLHDSTPLNMTDDTIWINPDLDPQPVMTGTGAIIYADGNHWDVARRWDGIEIDTQYIYEIVVTGTSSTGDPITVQLKESGVDVNNDGSGYSTSADDTSSFENGQAVFVLDPEFSISNGRVSINYGGHAGSYSTTDVQMRRYRK